MFGTSPYIAAGVAFSIASLPTFAWLYFLFADGQQRKKLIAFIFFGGILTVIPLLIIQALFNSFPELNLIELIPEKIPSIALAQLAIIIFLGSLEEIFKQTFLRTVDSKWLIIQTVNDSIKFSMIAALGFSFAENIYPYFYGLIKAGNYQDLMGAFLVRSLFTSAMHMAVSGIFGYYYGMSKFAIDFREQSKWTGEKMYLTQFITSIFNIPQSEAYREQKILHGLLIAMGIHAAFNFLVHYQLVLPALLLVIASFGYLLLLMNRKAGNLILTTDIDKDRQMLPKKDEDVVTELVGMWFNDKRYNDVISICERMLQRDPENNVIKIFKAKAVDQLEGNDPYKKALSSVFEKTAPVEDKSVLNAWVEMQKKQGIQLPSNFQNSPEFQKFLKEEERKKASSPTFKLDLE